MGWRCSVGGCRPIQTAMVNDVFNDECCNDIVPCAYDDALFKKNNTVETLLHENLGGAFSPPAAHKIPDLPICRCRAHGAVTLRRATPTTAWRRHRAPTPLHVSSASSPEAKRVRRSMNERPASRRAQSRTLVQSERELGRRPTTQCSSARCTTFLRSEVLFLTPFETLGNLSCNTVRCLQTRCELG